MSSIQLPLTALKISLINVEKIGCMSREKYKQTICFSPVVFICFSTCWFFPKRLRIYLRTIRLRPVCVYLWGRFGTLFTPGVEQFCGDIWSLTVIVESSFLGIFYFLQWFENYIVCFVWYLYC